MMKKTVVGRPGTTIPIEPMATAIQPETEPQPAQHRAGR